MSVASTPLMPLLQVQDLHVAFGGKPVVQGVSFALHAGEKLALVGESGSGKSVTALSLLRLMDDAQISGSAKLDRRDLLTLSERELLGVRGSDVAMIFQEPMTALNPLMRIGQQIAEVLQLKQGLGAQAAWAQAVELLAATGIPQPAQRAMLAMALASRPKLLLADEPTTALDVALRTQMLELLSDLQRQTGMAVLLITHDLHLVRRFADRVAVMQHGHIVEQAHTAHLFANPQHPYTRQLLDSTPQRHVHPVPDDAPVNIAAEQLRVAYPTALPGLRGWFKKGEFVAVQGANFQLRQGQTLAVVGESGSGKSTLAQAVLGLLPSQGTLAVEGQAWQQPATRNPPANQAVGGRVQVVFQGPFSALSPRLTVEEIVGEGLRVHAPQLDASARRHRVVQALAEVGLHSHQFPGLLQRYPHAFSGGQRQRLAIARALILQPQVLVLDEPTSALDARIQKQVLALLQQLQREHGLAYLLITHDMDVVRALAPEVLVVKSGSVGEAGGVDAVLDTPQHPYTQQLVQAML